MSHHNLALTACALSLTLMSGAAAAQQPTPEEQAFIDHMMKNAAAMQQWGDVVRYRVVGVFKGQVNASSEPNWIAYVDATDRVEVTFDWGLTEGKVIGQPQFQNYKSTVANPRNPEAKCAPPEINGEYEHANLTTAKHGVGSTLELTWQTTFPAVGVHQFCTGAVKAIPPAKRPVTYSLPVVAPTILGMQSTSDVQIAKDQKSFTVLKGPWNWTFTPLQR